MLGTGRWSDSGEYVCSVGPFRDAVLAILAAIAKQERVMAGLNRAKAQGKILGRPKAAVPS